MKQEWLETTQDVFTILLNHLLVIAAIITFYDLFQVDGAMIMVCLLSLLIPFGYYYITHRPQKLLLPPLFIIILQIFAIVEKFIQANDWGIYYIVIAFVYFVGYFLCYFIHQYVKFLSLNRNSASNIPEWDMFQSGVKQTMIFGGFSISVFLITVNFDWVKKITDQLWVWFLQLLGYIFAGFDTPPPPTEEMPMQNVNQATSDIGNVVDREMFPVFMQQTVKTIVTVAVFLSLIGGCILLLLLIFEFIRKYLTPLKRRKKQGVFRENEDIREYCGIEIKASKKEKRFLFWNHREKVRKIYLKKILKRKKELIGEKNQRQLEYMTAKECCDCLSEQNLQLVYEKARYSAEHISAEDVRLARSQK